MHRALAVMTGLARLGAALALVWLCWQDWPAMQARDAFERLPPYDPAAEASVLLSQNRISEALRLIEDARAENPQDARLLIIEQGLEAERRNWMRQLAAGGRGAWTGEGTDAASLGGAVIADLFVFGDVRDLVVQSGRWLRGEQTDALIVALSAGGILLTVSPSVDLGAALVKQARRMNALSDAFVDSVLAAARQAVRKRRSDALADITGNVAALARHTRPAGAVTVLRHIDDPVALRRAAQFAARPEGRRALLLDPATTVRWLKSGWPHAEEWLTRAARKGRAGLDYLARNSSMMFKAHPVLGLVKGLYKGNLPDLLLTLARRFGDVLLGLAAAWALYEALRLVGVALGPGPSRSAPPPEYAPAR